MRKWRTESKSSVLRARRPHRNQGRARRFSLPLGCRDPAELGGTSRNEVERRGSSFVSNDAMMTAKSATRLGFAIIASRHSIPGASAKDLGLSVVASFVESGRPIAWCAIAGVSCSCAPSDRTFSRCIRLRRRGRGNRPKRLCRRTRIARRIEDRSRSSPGLASGNRSCSDRHPCRCTRRRWRSLGRVGRTSSRSRRSLAGRRFSCRSRRRRESRSWRWAGPSPSPRARGDGTAPLRRLDRECAEDGPYPEPRARIAALARLRACALAHDTQESRSSTLDRLFSSGGASEAEDASGDGHRRHDMHERQNDSKAGAGPAERGCVFRSTRSLVPAGPDRSFRRTRSPDRSEATRMVWDQCLGGSDAAFFFRIDGPVRASS